MASIVSTQVRAYRHIAELPKEVWCALSQHEAAANVILPFAHKQRALNSPRGTHNEQLWIALYDDAKNVEFVLSCTKGPLGNYPIFIVPCKSSAQLAQEERHGRNLANSVSQLVLCLLSNIPPQRVFSVFSTAKVTRMFAEIFENHTRQYGISAILKEPYYDATFTFCTSQTLRQSSECVSSLPWSEDIVVSLRRADMSHLKELSAMCKAFSETSPPFLLDDARAELEARLLITNQQVWVHLVQKADHAPEIACLIATTRESDNVTAVTKVFTAEHWRGRGCAARLLHRVCQDILQKKERVVLYVGNSDELASARKVYHKIGFQGLDAPAGQKVKGVEKWVEIGFEGTELGFW